VLVLALDTASPSGSIAVLRDEKVIGVICTTSEETYSSRMFRQLEFLLAELGIAQNQFDLYAVNSGPGSFTGLRVGITAAKGWAEAYGKPVVAVSGLEAVAEQSRRMGVLVPVIDARRGQLYFGFYRREPARLVREGDERVATPAEFHSALHEIPEADEVTMVTFDLGIRGQVQGQISAPRFSVEVVSGVLAPTIGRIACDRAKRGEVADAVTLDANYVRRSDAELHWKGPS
jgi:tRNA threonylcarbamoyladenosine biosynthesis protein TsaB